MAWIPMIPEDEAEGELKEWYDRLRDPWGGVDDIMRIHSISLPTMKGHYELYKSAMTGNPDLSSERVSTSPDQTSIDIRWEDLPSLGVR